VSFGGFAAGPGGLAAWLRGLPLLVHEQNRAPGFTNRVLSRLSRRVLTGFPGTFARREEHVGNPVRSTIIELPAPERRMAQRDGQPMRLLVLGGSQGARALNQAVPTALAALGLNIDVRHQSGEKLHEEARAPMPRPGSPRRWKPSSATWPRPTPGPTWWSAAPVR
jgi:UDP-N-acetylglucosamine--N-acetylmuramyl-(pentapeptide) pyrophosphoryl-undecaprenol N-acetylglucosamine transferase